jgi:hypothetical protein
MALMFLLQYSIAVPVQQEKYGMLWMGGMSNIEIEMEMVRRGGQWTGKRGQVIGNGLYWHYKKLEELLWPKEKVWHRWNELQLEMYLSHRTIGIMGPSSSGKAQPMRSLVYTPVGPKRMGDIRVGDSVCVPFYKESGTKPFAQVTGVYPQGERDVYRLHFNDGTSVDASDEHLWAVERKHCWNPVRRTVTTKWLFDSIKEHPRWAYHLEIKNTDPMEFFSWPKDRLHPYLLGVLLGDGGLTGNGSVIISGVDKELFDRIKPMIPDGLSLKLNDRCSYRISGPNRGGAKNPLLQTLKSLGLMGKGSHEKFVPRSYLYGSIDDRIELIRGLLDTDGYASKKTGAVIFYSTSTQLAKDFQLLIQSIGGTCKTGIKQSHFKYNEEKRSGRPCCICTVNYHNPEGLFFLPRKKRSCRPRQRGSGFRHIVKIDFIGREPVQCILVDHPEHLYITDNCVPTHNTNGAATDVLTDYYCYPNSTTILVCSTTKERMQDRIFGEMKKYHRLARVNHPNLPGHAIDGRMRIVTEARGESEDGRDFRNGIIGVPCLMGGDFKGISEFIGIKNERIRAVFDELQMLPPAVLLAISNLDKNQDFKMIGLGNPKETTDALGILCEPSFQLGGWDSGIDQTPKTKTWETRRPNGVCIQFVGTDSPNLDGKMGIPLITQEAINRDIAQYGQDSLQFTMMNQGMMPRGQGSRRVLTAQLCRKNRAQDQPLWLNSTRTRLAFLDAAYGGVGGDRCIFGEIQFGAEATTFDAGEVVGNLISQTPQGNRNRQILHLVDVVNVPINVTENTEPEEQIVNFVQAQCVTRNIPPDNFYYESGMRTSLVSAFARLWSPRCNPVDCGGKPGEQMVSAQIQVPRNKYYSKMITEIWFSVRMIVEAGQFRGMTDSVMREFCAREWTMVGNNLIEVEPKIKMKEKIGRSPDIADAVAIGCLGAQRLGFVIDNQVNKKAIRQSNLWKNELRERSRNLWSAGDLTHK